MQKPALILSRDWEQYQTLAAAVRPLRLEVWRRELKEEAEEFFEIVREHMINSIIYGDPTAEEPQGFLKAEELITP